MKKTYAIKGDICYSKSLKEISYEKDSYLIVENGESLGVFDHLDEKYKDIEVLDYTGKLVIPGLTDLHLHAPQYEFMGLGMDLELLDWLDTYTFPAEEKYENTEYAKRLYTEFVNSLVKSPATRAVMFSSIHVKSTEILMDLMEKSGLVSYVGKVNMNRNSSPKLTEKDSAAATIEWLKDISNKYENTYPIITPRFIPSCSDELMEELSNIQKEYNLPAQSHLSENKSEIDWVKELCPWAETYGAAYDKFELFGSSSKTVMAHCVWSNDEERALMKKRGTFVAHCASSNMNLSSGIAPVRKFLDEGLKVGIGSDIAGGSNSSLFQDMVDAIHVSKLYWRLVDVKCKALSFTEVFYLASIGGGEFFGNVGSFKKGYEADALVIDDSSYNRDGFNLEERLERTIYLSKNSDIVHKFVRGKKLF